MAKRKTRAQVLFEQEERSMGRPCTLIAQRDIMLSGDKIPSGIGMTIIVYSSSYESAGEAGKLHEIRYAVVKRGSTSPERGISGILHSWWER